MTDYVLVRREPTEEMIHAGNCARVNAFEPAANAYRAMCAATPPPSEDEALVERLARRLDEIEDATKPCPRCEGKGYHHGFGEDGHDPDWCEVCGGPGLVPTYPTTIDRIRAILDDLKPGD